MSSELLNEKIGEKVEDQLLDKEAVTTFVFNDTVVNCLESRQRSHNHQTHQTVLRALASFMAIPWLGSIMFRGTVAEGASLRRPPRRTS